ncbi:uncharacterized protein [Apostichopus japonicus]|uniref:uncharacterized protein n=1 Tax=Stichopus japonicus TaxID=307972 RepID=UPI003AB3DA25
MSRRSTHHASAARGAPFGTDVQPKLNVKIIGGVAVEIPVDSPPSSAGSKNSQANLRAGPHGTPPLQTQPLNTDYIRKDSRESSSHEKRTVNSLTGLHPTTSPSDSSNSHIHDRDGRGGSFPNPNRILPPISSPKIPEDDNHNSRHRQSPLPLQPPRISPAQPEITLFDQLRPYLIDYDSYRFKEMYGDLAEFDRKLTGHVTQGQVNMISLKYQLPVPTPLMKLLLSSFGHDSKPDLVNYEKLIQYLARVQLGTANAETLLQESVKKFVDVSVQHKSNDALDYQIAKFEHGEDTAQLQYQTNPGEEKRSRESSRRETDEVRWKDEEKEEIKEVVKEKVIYVATKKPFRKFPEQENAKFTSLLKQQYTLDENDVHDFDAVREKFTEHDKSGTGVVTRQQIDQVCLYFRVPVQGSLMDKLLQRCETDSGKFSWVDFVDYLEGAQPKARSESKVRIEPKPVESERPTTWPTPKGSTRTAKQEPPRSLAHHEQKPLWEQRKPLGRLETRSPKKTISDVEHEITRNDTPAEDRISPSLPPSTAGSDEVTQLRALAREHRQKRESQQRAALQNHQTAQRPDDDPWFDRFMHLARGVYNSDSTNTGFLENGEMFRLIKNYNLIYQLGLTNSRIQNIVTSYSQGNKQVVPIEPVLAALRLEKPK